MTGWSNHWGVGDHDCCGTIRQQSGSDEAADHGTCRGRKNDYFGVCFPNPPGAFQSLCKEHGWTKRLLAIGSIGGHRSVADSPEEWGQGAKGYGKRYASGLAQNAIQQTVTYGLDMALQLDTGFQKSKREGFFPRLKDALVQNITSRNKSGKRVISVPRFAGVYTGAIVSREAWYPDRYSYKDGLRQGTGTLLTGFGINVVREFLINW